MGNVLLTQMIQNEQEAMALRLNNQPHITLKRDVDSLEKELIQCVEIRLENMLQIGDPRYTAEEIKQAITAAREERWQFNEYRASKDATKVYTGAYKAALAAVGDAYDAAYHSPKNREKHILDFLQSFTPLSGEALLKILVGKSLEEMEAYHTAHPSATKPTHDALVEEVIARTQEKLEIAKIHSKKLYPNAIMDADAHLDAEDQAYQSHRQSSEKKYPGTYLKETLKKAEAMVGPPPKRSSGTYVPEIDDTPGSVPDTSQDSGTLGTPDPESKKSLVVPRGNTAPEELSNLDHENSPYQPLAGGMPAPAQEKRNPIALLNASLSIADFDGRPGRTPAKPALHSTSKDPNILS